MKYGLLALVMLAIIPGCSCMRKEEGKKGKPAKHMAKKQAPKKYKKAAPKKGMPKKTAQRPMAKAAPKKDMMEMEDMDIQVRK